jgi:hypothetical protein
MAIDVLTICEWVDRSVNHTEIKNPSWFDVEEAIRSLNNAERNDLYLIPDENDPETYLGIGGGDGRYLVTGSVRNERFPTIVDPEKPTTPKELLLVGGQDGDYPCNWIIDLETALNAARVFYDSGTFASGPNWQDV